MAAMGRVPPPEADCVCHAPNQISRISGILADRCLLRGRHSGRFSSVASSHNRGAGAERMGVTQVRDGTR